MDALTSLLLTLGPDRMLLVVVLGLAIAAALRVLDIGAASAGLAAAEYAATLLLVIAAVGPLSWSLGFDLSNLYARLTSLL